jgi:hypothetical protein
VQGPWELQVTAQDRAKAFQHTAVSRICQHREFVPEDKLSGNWRLWCSRNYRARS